MKLSIIVPIFNEEKTVRQLLDRLVNLDLTPWQKEIVVVDDRSTDSTRKILESLPFHLKIIRHKKNLGKGAAIRTGLGEASGEYVIIQDADLEYNPNDIQVLLAAAKNNPGYAIYGSRFRGRHVDTVFGHKTANLFLTLVTNLLYGSEISDMETCYKLIPRDLVKKLKLSANRFDFEPEVTAKLLKLNVGILEVPISYKKRGFTQAKKLNWKDGVWAIYTLFKYRVSD